MMSAVTPFKVRSNIRQFMAKSSSTTSLYLSSKQKKKKKYKNKNKSSDIIGIKRENYKMRNQCNSQQKRTKVLVERICELKSENEKLKSDHNLQKEMLKKLKAKFLHVPNNQVLTKQCIEFKNKVDSYKEKCNKLQIAFIKSEKENKAMRQQLNNTNTALHNVLSAKYIIINDDDSPSKAKKSSPPSPAAMSYGMQKDIDKLEELIQDLDYDKDCNQDIGKESEQILNVKQILFEHGSLQNDNRDLALEIVSGQETNAKLSQSVNDLWLFANQLLLKLEKQSTLKNYTNNKMSYINQQLIGFKKMFHRTTFYFTQLSTDYMKQFHELKRILSHVLNENKKYKAELKENSKLKIENIKLRKAIKKYETEIIQFKNDKLSLINKYEISISQATKKAIQTQQERNVLLQKLDSLIDVKA